MRYRIPVLVLSCLLLAGVAGAGTDTGAALSAGRTVGTAEDVRQLVSSAMLEWAIHPTDIPNASCTGAGTPQACCTGVGTGTCIDCGGGDCCNSPATDTECLAFARDFILPASAAYPSHGGWAYKVERQCSQDADWICNPQNFPGQGDGFTPAAAVPNSAVVLDDVASWLSNLAADIILP